MTPTPSPKAHCGSLQSPTTAPAFRVQRAPAPAEKIGEKTLGAERDHRNQFGGFNYLEDISQWEGLSDYPICYGKNVPNHQPEIVQCGHRWFFITFGVYKNWFHNVGPPDDDCWFRKAPRNPIDLSSAKL
jgi:hypothetical protein